MNSRINAALGSPEFQKEILNTAKIIASIAVLQLQCAHI